MARWFFGSCRGDLPDLGVRAGAYPLSPPNPEIYPVKSQRAGEMGVKGRVSGARKLKRT